MTYGMKLFDSFGATTYDTSSIGGVFVQTVTFPANNSSGVVYLPDYVYGMSIVPIVIQRGSHNYSLETGTQNGTGYTRFAYSPKTYTLSTGQQVYAPSEIATTTIILVFAQ